MPQINCPDCNHPMSDQAKVCPNCNAPRIIGNTKNCVKCGTQMEARKKKCPECEAPQYDSLPESKSKPSMATPKKSSTGALLGGLFIGLIIGGLVMFVVYPFIMVQNEDSTAVEIDPSFGSVSKKNGLYVFINSQPQKPTMSLGSYKYNVLNRINDILNTKGNNALDEPTQVLNMMVIDRRLEEITSEVKSQYPDAECVVFTGNLNNCEVYKFK